MRARFPTAIDDASSLFSPADTFWTKPLETITTMLVQANDSTISVKSAGADFADEYGILSIDNELTVYALKTTAQSIGCQRCAFGTVATQRSAGATLRANMVTAYIEAPAVSRHRYRRAVRHCLQPQLRPQERGRHHHGAQELRRRSGTGLRQQGGHRPVRLPNTGAMKWRKADGSGDLRVALNANDHPAADAIIDFAPGQTFRTFSYPDAGYGNKGIVQVGAAGGLAVDAGLLAMAQSGASPGTYPKVNVDGREGTRYRRRVSGCSRPAGPLSHCQRHRERRTPAQGLEGRL